MRNRVFCTVTEVTFVITCDSDKSCDPVKTFIHAS
jgi:hypothetical protein